jgi:1-aminocyclopropane-1-carboxylate deaminase/D-cysteine desulfhydrase-like pyridoxal-dependent ACC family enzyme
LLNILFELADCRTYTRYFRRWSGFARWAQEVAEQEEELGVFFDTVITCSVTGSTQAGMIAGFALQDTERKVLGIDHPYEVCADETPSYHL